MAPNKRPSILIQAPQNEKEITGQVGGIKLNKVSLLKDRKWSLMSLHSKQEMLKCDCTENSVQDIQHLVYECGARGHLMDAVLLKTREL